MKINNLSSCLAALILIALVTFTSCTKKESAEVAPDLDSLILGKWQITSVMINGKETFDTYFSECDKDNIIVIEASGKGFMDWQKPCGASQKSEPVIWKWSDKTNKKLLMDLGAADFSEFTITEINEKIMKASLKDGSIPTMTFTKL